MSEKPEEHEEADIQYQGKTLYDFLDKFGPEDYKVFLREFKEIALETHTRMRSSSQTKVSVYI